MLSTRNPRESYGLAILEAAKDNPKIVVLTADVMHSSQTVKFKEIFPDRFINMGVAEQNMAGVAAGLATHGKIPFINTFSCFASMRSLEMLRSDIAYPNLNVKVVSFNSGLSLGTGGTTHHSTEDLAIIRSIANFTLIVPGDAAETYQAVLGSISHPGPVYIRLGRGDMEDLGSENSNYQIGKAKTMHEGNDVTIIACGYLVAPALKAAKKLSLKGISTRVLNLHTLKPLDEKAILSAAKETKGIVTVEEHSVVGGVGSAVAEYLSKHYPTHIRMIGIQDTFCTIGPTEDLMKFYGFTEENIAKQAIKIVSL